MATNKKSCLKCSRYMMCKDNRKNTRGHFCDRFRRIKEVDDVSELGFVRLTPEPEPTPEKPAPRKRSATNVASASVVSAPEFDIEIHEELPDNFILEAMNRAYDPHTNTVRDLRVDDSSLPLAKNYYDYCAKLSGTRIKMPFARQLWICLVLMGEVCFKCTHPKAADMFNVPVDLDPHRLARSMVLLEYGVCPKCGSSKHSLIQNNVLNDYNELVFVGGQRCVTGDTRVLTETGTMTFAQIAKLHPQKYGSSKYSGPRLIDADGKKLQPTKFFTSKPEPLIEVTLANGLRIRGTKDHPLMSASGDWVKLKDVKAGMQLSVPFGQKAFSKKTYVAPCGTKLTKSLAGYLGYVTSEGHSYATKASRVSTVSVSNKDKDVLTYCQTALSEAFPEYDPSVGRRPDAVRVFKEVITSRLDGLMDGQLSKNRTSAFRFIPTAVWLSPKHVVQEYLRCLFEGDGTIGRNGVSYTSISRRLIDDLQVLLLNLGIPCNTSSRKKWATNGSVNQVPVTAYTLSVFGTNALTAFQKLVGFKSQRKQSLLNAKVAHLSEAKLSSVPWHERLSEVQVQTVDTLFFDIESAFCSHPNSHYLDSLGRNRQHSVRSLTGVRWRKSRSSKDWVLSALSRLKSCPLVWGALPKELKDRILNVHQDLLRSVTHSAVVKIVTTTPEVTYDVHVPEVHRFMANGLLNHNSGKSTIAATLATYVLHRYLKSPKLSSLTNGIQDFTPLTASFVALTVTKALKLLWVPVRDMIGASQWFTDYFALLDDIGRKSGKELYQFKPNGTYLRVFHKSLEMLPDGPSKRNLRGATRYLCVSDELGWFPYDVKAENDDTDQSEERERANADEVHIALDNSLATVRAVVPTLYTKNIFTVPQALNLNLSSPSSWRDKIMRLWKESQNSKFILGVKAATWEISPLYSRDHPFIVDKFNRNPKNAARDFGAEPPALSSNVFDKTQLQGVFTQKMWYRVAYDSHPDKTSATLVEMLEPSSYPPSVLSLDAGLVDNSFALTLLHKSGDMYVAPLLIEVMPEAGKPIRFPLIYEKIIKPIIKACNVRLLTADRWNSVYILDQAREDFPNQVITKQITLNSADFKQFKMLANSGQLSLPALELEVPQIEAAVDYRVAFRKFPAAHLFSQFLTVQEIGGVFHKGENATDDLLRSLVVATTTLQDPKFAEYIRKSPTRSRETVSSQAIVLVGSRGGMSAMGWPGSWGR